MPCHLHHDTVQWWEWLQTPVPTVTHQCVYYYMSCNPYVLHTRSARNCTWVITFICVWTYVQHSWDYVTERGSQVMIFYLKLPLLLLPEISFCLGPFVLRINMMPSSCYNYNKDNTYPCINYYSNYIISNITW